MPILLLVVVVDAIAVELDIDPDRRQRPPGQAFGDRPLAIEAQKGKPLWVDRE